MRLLLHGRISGAGGGSDPAPAILTFQMSGVKRRNEPVWLAVSDDGTANRYKFDIQAAGASLTGVTVDDNGTTSTVSFPYVTTSPSIAFIVPASLVDRADYVVNAYASSNGGSTWSAATAADEFFGTTDGVYFSPETRTISSITRLTGSGATPMQVQINGAVYDSDLIKIEHYDATSVLIETSIVPVTEASLDTPFTLDLSGATDPTPFPLLTAGSSTDHYGFQIVSGDYDVNDIGTPISGIASNGVTVNVNDTLTSMTWSSSDKTANIAISGAGLVASETLGSSNWGAVRGARQLGFNKTYWEVTGNTAGMEFGVCDGGVSLPSGVGNYWGLSAFGQVPTAHAAGWQANDSQLYYNNTNTTVVGFSSGDVIGVCYDKSVEKVWWTKTGTTWLPSGDPAAGTGGLSVPGLDADVYLFANVGQSSATTLTSGTTPGGTAGFARTPPTGFVAP